MSATAQPTPAEVQFWLEWAGARMLSLPNHRLLPASYRSFWPEIEPELYANLLNDGKNNATRLPIPSGPEIDLADEILTIIPLVPHQPTRRVLQLRSLVHPINGKYKFGWMRIAIKMELDRKTVKRLHGNGLSTLARIVPETSVCRFNAFLA